VGYEGKGTNKRECKKKEKKGKVRYERAEVQGWLY